MYFFFFYKVYVVTLFNECQMSFILISKHIASAIHIENETKLQIQKYNNQKKKARQDI